jgi:hypothetical protein
MWKVHRLREIRPTISWVFDYSENSITQHKGSVIVNNLDFDLNVKDKFTCELSTCGIDGSPDVMGRGNDSGVPYEEYSYCKKSLVTPLRNV